MNSAKVYLFIFTCNTSKLAAYPRNQTGMTDISYEEPLLLVRIRQDNQWLLSYVFTQQRDCEHLDESYQNEVRQRLL
jgi:hypothetical protein